MKTNDVFDHHVPNTNTDPYVPTALQGAWAHSPISLRERAMLWFMNDVTDRQDWKDTITDDKLMLKWMALLRPDGVLPERRQGRIGDTPDPFVRLPPDIAVGGFTPDMFMFCVRELREKAKYPIVPVLDADASVLKGFVSPDLTARAEEGIRQLRLSVPAPASKLIDPSEYPLVYDTTRQRLLASVTRENCLSTFSTGRPIPRPVTSVPSELLSRHFAQIPTDVEFASDGKSRLLGYINNLHPSCTEMYTVIEQLLDAAMPALVYATERLKRTQNAREHRIPWLGSAAMVECRTPAICRGYCRPRGVSAGVQERLFIDSHIPRSLKPRTMPTLPDDVFDSASRCWFPGCPRLQVVVKTESYELTPTRPKLDGTEWQVEGLLNEHIVATAMFVHDSDNVAPRVAFRARKGDEPPLDDDSAIPSAFVPGLGKISPEGRASQELVREMARVNFYGRPEVRQWWQKPEPAYLCLGDVEASTGRLIVWPNVLEHRFEPFELIDRRKPGSLKFITISLVDPNIRIPSTSYIPPQRADWVPCSEDVITNMLAKLPVELMFIILRHVRDDTSCPYRADMAARLRKEMEVERRPRSQAPKMSARSNTPSMSVRPP